MSKFLNDRFVNLYTYAIAFLSFLAIAASISYGFREVRGTYRWFTLVDSNAVLFFSGALLLGCSIFVAVIRTLGPLGFSAAELFWKFPGVARLSKNPWNTLAIWGAVGAWALLAVLLATIFAPLSAVWLIGTAAGAIAIGFLLVFGALGAQVLQRTRLLNAWALVCSLVGTFVTYRVTTSDSSTHENLILLATVVIFLTMGAVLSVVLGILAARKPLDYPTAMNGYARRAELLAALANAGSPQGFKYFGASQQFFRKRISRITPVWLSLATIADSWVIVAGVFVFSLPLGIFFGVALGQLGAVLVVMMGCWVIATLLRWLCREWTAQRSLRAWVGGSYLRQLFGFSVGPALACCLYAALCALVFGLPFSVVLIVALMGITVSLGDENPPQHINYDLVVVTPEGVSLPVELVTLALGFLVLVGIHVFAAMTFPPIGIAIALLLVGVSLFQHFRASK